MKQLLRSLALPLLNSCTEGAVGGEARVLQGLVCHGTGGVAQLQPLQDGGALVGEAVRRQHRLLHNFLHADEQSAEKALGLVDSSSLPLTAETPAS